MEVKIKIHIKAQQLFKMLTLFIQIMENFVERRIPSNGKYILFLSHFKTVESQLKSIDRKD